jgi:hypothetical protein
MLYINLVSHKTDPDVNKEEEQSTPAHNEIGGRRVRICQPGAHLY